MATTVFIFVVILYHVFVVLGSRKCDTSGILLYEDMACTPTARNKSTGCPIAFNCPNLRQTEGECYYKNVTYKVGESVNDTDVFCDVGCFCQEDNTFACAIIDCIEYFGIPPNPGCYITYDLEACCSIDKNCDKCPDTCEFEGETYKFGERFFPKKSCSMCVCQKGFRGKIEEPFCTARKCNVELKSYNKAQEKCAPFYNYKSDLENNILCCPSSEWICPNGTEVVGGHIKSDSTCYFGEQTLKVGQTIERDTGSQVYGVAVCECRIPPLLTCVPKTHYPILI